MWCLHNYTRWLFYFKNYLFYFSSAEASFIWFFPVHRFYKYLETLSRLRLKAIQFSIGTDWKWTCTILVEKLLKWNRESETRNSERVEGLAVKKQWRPVKMAYQSGSGGKLNFELIRWAQWNLMTQSVLDEDVYQ